MAVAVIAVRGQRGWTIIDALLSMVFLAILAGILHSVAITALHAVRVRQVADDLDETARIALEIMARDIRETGFALGDSADRGLRAAGPMLVSLARDFDLDGATDSSNERVAYELDDQSGQLRRRLGNAPPQPMVDNLDREQAVFRYRDAAGAVIAPGSDLDAAERAEVRQVEVTLLLRSSHPVDPTREIVVEHRTAVGLRNGDL